MSFNFIVDRIIKDKAYPALSTWPAEPYTNEWRQFSQHWPYTVPSDLHEHCLAHNFPMTTKLVSDNGSGFYIISPKFFDLTIDYIQLLSDEVLTKLKQNQFRLLFYYDEGDNPYQIKERLDYLCQLHNLSIDCYRFISGNTAADHIPGFVYFPGHELLYWLKNKQTPATAIHTGPRQKDFTVLSRTHKWWRATVMADLYRQGVLNNSYWSYNTQLAIDDDRENNPIAIGNFNGLTDAVHTFLSQGPYSCDSFTEEQHNNHSLIVPEHFNNAYCNIVLETYYDADCSKGAFLTEKTFKPINHGQPFIIIGAAGSLAALRQLGYRTFDSAIDNSYDLEQNNTLRWRKIMAAIKQIQTQNLQDWFLQCVDDVRYNQQLFAESKYSRLNTLYDKLLH
jgi:hypothetical protein